MLPPSADPGKPSSISLSFGDDFAGVSSTDIEISLSCLEAYPEQDILKHKMQGIFSRPIGSNCLIMIVRAGTAPGAAQVLAQALNSLPVNEFVFSKQHGENSITIEAHPVPGDTTVAVLLSFKIQSYEDYFLFRGFNMLGNLLVGAHYTIKAATFSIQSANSIGRIRNLMKEEGIIRAITDSLRVKSTFIPRFSGYIGPLGTFYEQIMNSGASFNLELSMLSSKTIEGLINLKNIDKEFESETLSFESLKSSIGASMSFHWWSGHGSYAEGRVLSENMELVLASMMI